MKVKVTLTEKGFFFIGDLGLSHQHPSEVVDLSDKSDAFIATVVSGSCLGKLEIDKDPAEVVCLIKNLILRLKVAKACALDITKVPGSDVDNSPAEEIPATDSEIKETVVPPTEEELLAVLLEGNARKVVDELSKANLTKKQLKQLLDIETAGKDRAAVKAAISSLLG